MYKTNGDLLEPPSSFLRTKKTEERNRYNKKKSKLKSGRDRKNTIQKSESKQTNNKQNDRKQLLCARFGETSKGTTSTQLSK